MAKVDDIVVMVTADTAEIGLAFRLLTLAFGGKPEPGDVLDDLCRLVQQREDARREAGKYRMLYEASEADNEQLAGSLDRQAGMLAEQALLSQELRDRLDWYRCIAVRNGHAEFRETVQDAKRGLLKSQHRMNGES